MTDDNELIAGIAQMINDMNAAATARIDALEARIDDLAAQLAPPADTGLPSPRALQYMALSYFDNSADMARGKGQHVLKIEANKTRKSGSVRFDYALTAYLFEYTKFLKSFKLNDLDAKEAAVAKISPLAARDDFLFGMVRKQGGKQGTAVFADQLVIVQIADGAAVSCLLYVGEEYYQTKKWIKVDPKTGKPFKAANLKSKAICFPRDEMEDACAE